MAKNIDFIYDNEEFVDLYEIIGVEPEADASAIKSSYLKLVKQHHPDHGGNQELFLEITKAYEVLHNKESRKEYDVYYLKKSFEEFKEDNIFKLKSDFVSFVNSNTKPITEEKLNEIYKNIFDDEDKEEIFNKEELVKRMNDINFERENADIEVNDERIYNLVKDSGDNVNELFEYMETKNSEKNGKQIINQEIGTLDVLPGYSDNYASFLSDDEYFNSKLYTEIDSEKNSTKELVNNLDINDFKKWKAGRTVDKKLTSSEIDFYVEQRRNEEENIFKNLNQQLKKSTKKKETSKFLNTNCLMEDAGILEGISSEQSSAVVSGKRILAEFQNENVPSEPVVEPLQDSVSSDSLERSSEEIPVKSSVKNIKKREFVPVK